MNWQWFEVLRQHKHPHAHRVVGLALAIRAKHDDPVCYPSITTLCKDASVCRLTVVRAIERFEADGLIEVERAKGKVNHYRLTSTPQRRVPVHTRDGYPSTTETGQKTATRLPSKRDPSTTETRKGKKGNSVPEQDEHVALHDSGVPY